MTQFIGHEARRIAGKLCHALQASRMRYTYRQSRTSVWVDATPSFTTHFLRNRHLASAHICQPSLSYAFIFVSACLFYFPSTFCIFQSIARAVRSHHRFFHTTISTEFSHRIITSTSPSRLPRCINISCLSPLVFRFHVCL